MPLTPQDIIKKEFREAFRGYNQADVDLFLDEIVEEFSRLIEENQKLKIKLAAMQQELYRYRDARREPQSRQSSVPTRQPEQTERKETEVPSYSEKKTGAETRQEPSGPEGSESQRDVSSGRSNFFGEQSERWQPPR